MLYIVHTDVLNESTCTSMEENKLIFYNSKANNVKVGVQNHVYCYYIGYLSYTFILEHFESSNYLYYSERSEFG